MLGDAELGGWGFPRRGLDSGCWMEWVGRGVGDVGLAGDG
jgi:hypothetical protein